jgi:putative transport protein
MELFGGVLSLKGVLFLIFSVLAVIVTGYALGRIKIKGVSLGAAGVFITALVFGCIFYNTLGSELTADSASYVTGALKIIENVGLVMFVGAVGFMAGPGFFHNLKKNFKSYVILAAVLVLTGGLTCAACILIGKNFSTLDNKEFTAMLVGILSGALTSTPAFSAAKATVNGIAPGLEDLVTVGHGIAYLFGVVGIVLFVQLVPKILKADMAKEREILKAGLVSNENKKTQKDLFEFDKSGLLPFFFAAALGIFIGSFKLFNFSLTVTGGCLLTSLILGHFGHIGKISVMPKESTLKVFRELGLALFLAGAGIAGGGSFIKYFNAVYFIYGILMTVIPLTVGFIFAKFVLKMKLLDSLGAISGGRTSTPALGALINSSGTEDVGAPYAAAYPVALVLVVIVSEVLILVFGQ